MSPDKLNFDMNRFRKLVLFTLATSIIQTALGSYVRTSGSGLGCGTDWPKCAGSWLPPLETTAVIEYAHRLTASLLGLLVLAVAVTAWLRFRSMRAIFYPSFAALILVGVQAWLGREVVDKELARSFVAVHFLIAMTLIALLVILAVSTLASNRRSAGPGRLSILSATLVFIAVMVGAVVAQTGAGLVFSDWPLMGGGVLPGFGTFSEVIHWLHRLLALGVGIALGFLAFGQHEASRPVKALAHSAFGFWLFQMAVGALIVIYSARPWTVVLHVLMGSLVWASVVAVALLSNRSGEASEIGEARAAEHRTVDTIKAYFLLTKPRIIELLLIATVPSMILAAQGWPPVWLILATLTGGSLSAGAANAINCVLDRDIDSHMERTSGRPIPMRQVEPRNALVFGILLGAGGFLWLWFVVNPLAAMLSASALLFYVFVYTKWIKRKTPSNIVIGGAAGAVPVLVGWAAVTNRVELPALVLFAIIFYWTPPHFWALALRYRSDYAKAGVPMLPVVRGRAEVTRRMFLYSLILVSVSLLLYPVASMGIVYAGAAALLGAMFLIQCVRLHRRPSEKAAIQFFRHSITYLTLLFAAIAIDVLVPTTFFSR